MQKKLLSLMVMASCSLVHSYSADPMERLFRQVSQDDLKKPMGDLSDSVKDVDPCLLLAEMTLVTEKTAVISRLLREHEIKAYDVANRKTLEVALVKEFSGETGAVKKAFDESAQHNKKEEEDGKLEVLDASLSWTGSNPTEKSKVGRAYKEISGVRQKKDSINAKNYDLVIKNQNTVLNTLQQELKEKRFFMAKYAQAFPYYNKGTAFFTENGLNLEAAKKEDYFDVLCLSAYRNTVQKAQEMGITVSIEDMQNIAQKNPQTAMLAQELIAEQTNAKEERNKVLNPQPTPRINLTGDDVKEDQGNQGVLSQ